MGTEEEEMAKPFIKYPTALAFNSLPVQRSNDSPIKKTVDTENPQVAHVEVAQKCSICNADRNQRHLIMKAMKLACLKYSSGPVKHQGHIYDRMKLL